MQIFVSRCRRLLPDGDRLAAASRCRVRRLFIFIGPGIAEFTHFVFPLITPALTGNAAPITAVINGVRIDGMANHHVAVTGKYYFPVCTPRDPSHDPGRLRRLVMFRIAMRACAKGKARRCGVRFAARHRSRVSGRRPDQSFQRAL
jgi:hypothetical protein